MTLLASEKFSVLCINASEKSVKIVNEFNDVIQPLFKQIQQVNIADKLCSKLQTVKLKVKEKCYEITLWNCFICKEVLYQYKSLWVLMNDKLILKLICEVHVPSSDKHKDINWTVKLIKQCYH